MDLIEFPLDGGEFVQGELGSSSRISVMLMEENLAGSCPKTTSCRVAIAD